MVLNNGNGFLKELLWHDMRPTPIPTHFPLATAVPEDVATRDQIETKSSKTFR